MKPPGVGLFRCSGVELAVTWSGRAGTEFRATGMIRWLGPDEVLNFAPPDEKRGQ